MLSWVRMDFPASASKPKTQSGRSRKSAIHGENIRNRGVVERSTRSRTCSPMPEPYTGAIRSLSEHVKEGTTMTISLALAPSSFPELEERSGRPTNIAQLLLRAAEWRPRSGLRLVSEDLGEPIIRN